MPDDTTAPRSKPQRAPRAPAPLPQRVLAIIWSDVEPWRAGENTYVPAGAERVISIGRGLDKAPARFHRQGRGGLVTQPPLASKDLSRMHVTLRSTPKGLAFKKLGTEPIFVNDVECDEGELVLGDVLRVPGYALLFELREPMVAPCDLPNAANAAHAWGMPDVHGIIGESPAAWALRDEIASAADSGRHTLILGPTGAGKELCARAVHTWSSRARGPYVVTNAATLTSELAAAELFGSLKNFPNGSEERKGFVGEAEGGTLFLDEIGELPREAQSKLLRLLSAGDYNRLGEAKARRANVVVVAAMNRPVTELKEDLEPRFGSRIHVPALSVRASDIPLLVRHLVVLAAKTSARAARYVVIVNGREEILIEASLMTALVRGHFPKNVRQLDNVLSRCIRKSGEKLEIVPGMWDEEKPATENEEAEDDEEPESPRGRKAKRPPVEAVLAALERNGWVQSYAAKELGISRQMLARIVAEHGLAPK